MDFHKKYRLVKEHDKHFEVHDLSDKTNFHVSKKQLHPATQIKIMKLQKFNDGGVAEEEDAIDLGLSSGIKPWVSEEPAPESTNSFFGLFPSDEELYGPKTTAPPVEQAAPVVSAPPPMMPAEPEVQTQAPMATPTQSAPTSSPVAAATDDVSKIEGAYAKATMAGAQAQAKQNEALAKVQEEYVKQLQEHQAVFDQKMVQLDKEAGTISQAIASSQIDPNKFFSSQSTGSKISSAIGILLSGIGAGLQGTTRNMAMEVIDKQIQNDIDAQKIELGKKQNLLSENLRRQGSLREAENTTRIQMMAAVQGQIAKVSAQTNNPILMAQAQQDIAKFNMQMLPLKQKTAQVQANQQIQNAISGKGATPEQIDAAINIVSAQNPERGKELRSRFVPGAGLATTSEGAKGVMEMKTMAESVKNEINKLEAIAKRPLKSLSLKDRAEAETIRRSLVGALRVPITGPGSMSEGERELLLDLVPDVAGLFSIDSVNKTKLETLKKTISDKYQSMAKVNGLNLKPEPGSDNSKEAARAWLKANPNHPKAKQVKAALGE